MNRHQLALIAIAAVSLASCKKDKDDDDHDQGHDHNASIQMRFDFVHGANAFDVNSIYADGAGHAIRFSKLKFYASDFVLKDDGGATVADFTNKAILVDAANPGASLEIGTMGHGHIHEVRFSLGLNSTLNHADPTAAVYPLNQADMHWSWNPMMGYIFLKTEGLVDANGDGVLEMGVDQPFEYHCATDPLIRSKQLLIHRDVDGGVVTVPVKVDVAVLLTGTDLLTNGTVHGGLSAAVALMDNLEIAISAP